MKRNFVFLILTLWSLLMLACASLDSDSKYQGVLVDAQPLGAKLYYKGEFKGTVPDVVFLERSRQDQTLSIVSTNNKQDFKIKSNYRWRESFISNLLLMSLAPFGWLTDLYTGAAWEYPKAIQPKIKNIMKKDYTGEIKTVAVAPIIGDDELFLQLVTESVENKLRKKEIDSKVLPYTFTHGIFYENNFSFYSWPSEEERNRAYNEMSKMGVDLIYESSYRYDNGIIYVLVKKMDAKKGGLLEPFEFTLDKSNSDYLRETQWRKELGKLYSFVPNTVAIDFASRRGSLNINGIDYIGEVQAPEGVIGQVAKIFGAVSIRKVQAPTIRNYWKYFYNFVPSFTFSYNKVIFKEMLAISDIEFRRIHLAGGYGLDLSYGSRKGRLALSIIPMFSYLDLSWQGKVSRGDESEFGLIAEIEFSYSFFASKNLNIKLFSRSTSDGLDIWEKAVDQITGQKNKLESPSQLYSGISLGYYFSDDINPLREMFK